LIGERLDLALATNPEAIHASDRSKQGAGHDAGKYRQTCALLTRWGVKEVTRPARLAIAL
jgi:hypothetical protein